MASRVFFTEEVLSFVVDNEEPEYDDPNEPIVDGSDEEFECTEESGDEGESAEEYIESVEENLECVETDMYSKYDKSFYLIKM